MTKQIDEKVDKKRNENQMCAFIGKQVVHIHILYKIYAGMKRPNLEKLNLKQYKVVRI
jgi:hypothetical protein